MGIANYTNFSELMNEMLKKNPSVSITDLVKEGSKRKIILASEGEMADQSDLENGFINLTDALFRAGAIKPNPTNETEALLVQLYESGELAKNGYSGKDSDRFLDIQWTALTDNLPVIVNINL
jgi:hypothetical protein